MQVDTSRGQLSFAGQRGVNANVSIDGADYNQPFFGGIRGGERSNTAFTIPQEAIKEFQVVASGYSAEFGRSTGGIVNAITKSGTNTPRGSLFYVNRNKEWAEQNAFGQNASPTQQQFGGSIGGAIRPNRLFYFGAGELQRLKNTRNVVFSLTGIAPTTPDTAEAYNFFKGLEEPFDATNDAEAMLGRVDYQLESGSRLAVRYSFSNNEAKNANATGNALSDTTISAVSNNGTEKDRTNTVVGEYTSALRSNLLAEVRAPVFTRAASTRRERPPAAHHRHRRQRRHGQLPRRKHPERLARSVRGERDVGLRRTQHQVRHRVQPCLRRIRSSDSTSSASTRSPGRARRCSKCSPLADRLRTGSTRPAPRRSTCVRSATWRRSCRPTSSRSSLRTRGG